MLKAGEATATVAVPLPFFFHEADPGTLVDLIARGIDQLVAQTDGQPMTPESVTRYEETSFSHLKRV